MTTTPEAIEKHWLTEHWLYCEECGLVTRVKTYNPQKYRREFISAWRKHLEEKHNGRKP